MMATSNLGQLQKGLVALAGVAALATLLASRQRQRIQTKQPWLDGPLRTLLPELSATEAEALPYPPDALPGRRDVPTPYGVIHVFEWGPEDGERVLFVHGIGTPCVALGGMAAELVEMGKCRVMVFGTFHICCIFALICDALLTVGSRRFVWSRLLRRTVRPALRHAPVHNPNTTSPGIVPPPLDW